MAPGSELSLCALGQALPYSLQVSSRTDKKNTFSNPDHPYLFEHPGGHSLGWEKLSFWHMRLSCKPSSSLSRRPSLFGLSELGVLCVDSGFHFSKVEWSYIVSCCSPVKDTATLSSKAATPFYIPANSAQGSNFSIFTFFFFWQYGALNTGP
jgi:hypothetical protein